MKSNIIQIDKTGKGFEDAVSETRKVVAYQELSKKEALQLELLTEEMLSLVYSLTGETQISFWIEIDGKECDLHLSTKTALDKEQRAQLLSSATSGKNEAAKTFLGYIRNAFENAMAAEPDHSGNDLPMDLLADLANHQIEDPDWDGYERSVLRKAADDVKIAIRGGTVDMTVTKRF